MKRRYVVAVVASVAVAVCLLVAPDAGATPPLAKSTSTKSFNWTFTGTCCVTSRPFTTTKKGPITITSVVQPCDTQFGDTEYVMQLLQDGKVVGTREHTCWGGARFKAKPAGTYRFRLTIRPPWKDSQTFTGYGTVYYVGGS